MKKIVLVLFVLCMAGYLYADVPNEIRYNGRLKSYQEPVNGTRQINFRIYESESGTPVWQSGNQSIVVSSGIFSYTISPGSEVDLRKGNLWLGLVVDGKELEPKEKLMAQPYAFHSRSAENLSSKNEVKIQIGDEVIYLVLKENGLHYKKTPTGATSYLGTPPGTVIAFAGPVEKAPEGYILCDGRSCNKNQYPALFDVISTTYGGSGDSFNVPNYKGMFLRGAGGQTVNDYPKNGESTYYGTGAAGVFQGDAIRNITGHFGATSRFSPSAGGNHGPFMRVDNGGSFGGSGEGGPVNINFDISRVVPVAVENRPVNRAVNYYIKY